jgi:hypothetical protein
VTSLRLRSERRGRDSICSSNARRLAVEESSRQNGSMAVNVKRPRCSFCLVDVVPGDDAEGCKHCHGWAHLACLRENNEKCPACNRARKPSKGSEVSIVPYASFTPPAPLQNATRSQSTSIPEVCRMGDCHSAPLPGSLLCLTHRPLDARPPSANRGPRQAFGRERTLVGSARCEGCSARIGEHRRFCGGAKCASEPSD